MNPLPKRPCAWPSVPARVRPAAVTPRATFLLQCVLAALGPVLLLGCGEPTSTPVADEGLASTQADVVYYGMRSHLTAEGIRSGEIRADSTYAFYRDSTVNHLFGVDMSVYNERGLEHAHVVSEEGRLDQRSEQMLARGNVVVTLPSTSTRIQAEELLYDPAAGQISSDSPVVVTHSGGVTRGSCFRSDLTFANWRLCDPVGAATFGSPGRDGSSP